jgi:hypothetical protein
MPSPPRIWLDYRPVRIGWVVTNQDIGQLVTAARWNACLWGGRHNCIIPTHDTALADRLVTCFGVDVLIPVQPGADAKAFVERFPHLEHHRWRESIFNQRSCEFADIRHPLRRIVTHQDKETERKIAIPAWTDNDPLSPLFTVQLGHYPTPDSNIPDYKAGVENAFKATAIPITATGELPPSLLDHVAPLALTSYDLSHERSHRGRQGPGIVLGSATDFDALIMFWNLRAAGAPLIFYDQNHSARLKPFANAFLSRLRSPRIGRQPQVTFWIRHDYPRDDSWKPDLELTDLPVALSDGRGDTIWNGLNIEPSSPQFSAWHRDVVPSYAETEGKASASFALSDRPFNDEDTQALTKNLPWWSTPRNSEGRTRSCPSQPPTSRALTNFTGGTSISITMPPVPKRDASAKARWQSSQPSRRSGLRSARSVSLLG